MKNVFLKVKIKSLAAEAQFIRKEERKIPGTDIRRQQLYHHRLWVVRREARATHLAYAFLDGTPYREVEQQGNAGANRCGVPLDEDAVIRMVKKYGAPRQHEQLAEWFATK